MCRMILIIAMLASIAIGCLDNPRDNPYDHWTTDGGPAADGVPPAPGNGGAIGLTVVNPTSVSLAWTKADDAVTLQGNLEYKVVYSENDDISNPDDIDDHGAVAQDWSKDLAAKSIAALTTGKTYYFNISVRDAKGNRAAYQRAAVDPLGVVYLFSTGERHNGNLGGRSGADGLCQSCYTNTYSSLNCANVRAFISVNGDDEIRDIPTKYGLPAGLVVQGPKGKQIAFNWEQLLDGSIEKSMEEAEVESAWNYWTGSNSNGSTTSLTCSGWTNGSGFPNWGDSGSHDQIGSQWLFGGGFITCDQEAHVILCVCWQ